MATKSLSGSLRYSKRAPMITRVKKTNPNEGESAMCRACLMGHQTPCLRPWCPCICRDPKVGWRIRVPRPVVTVRFSKNPDGYLVRHVTVADRFSIDKRQLSPGGSVQPGIHVVQPSTTHKENHMNSRKRQAGFSLIELLIVVAIILVIAAISVPSLLASRRASMQSAAVGDLKTITSATANYNQEFPLGTGTTTWTAFTLADLAGATCTGAYTASPTNACLIDSTLSAASAAPGKDGYTFTFTATGLNAWTCLADPITGNLYGNDKHFFVDQSGLVRFKVGGTASVTDPIVGQS